jgi:UDPglucose 6-dehydrogenase
MHTRVCVVGAGYVGLVTAACLARLGHHVSVVESDAQRLRMLRDGRAPFYEPGLSELLDEVLRERRLLATDDIAEGVADAPVVVIAVGTPSRADGRADLSQVRAAVAAVRASVAEGTVIALKSTVPPGTTAALHQAELRRGGACSVVAYPEFLREGSALADFWHPARIVVGGDDRVACARVMALHDGLPGRRIVTDPTSAELIKYGSNAFLSLKISFVNEIALLCELTNADIDAVADGVGADPRIGRAFLNAGLGFGGSCFPKDVRALDEMASYHGHSFWMLKTATEVNVQQRRRFVAKVQEAMGGRVAGRRIAVLGLAFKPDTDDMRQAPSLDVISHLQDLGARITATDPAALETARPLLPGVALTDDPYRCVRGADAVVLLTEWPELVGLDWARVATLVHRRVVVDGRNALRGCGLPELGFSYAGVGFAKQRPAAAPAGVRRAARRLPVGEVACVAS